MKRGMHVDKNGDKSWWLYGELHREDGPAVEEANGTKQWFMHGQRHREDGPAIEEAWGHKEWWVYGLQHRLDGPAVETAHGTKRWFKNGNWYYSFDEWLEDLDVSDEDKLILTLKWA